MKLFKTNFKAPYSIPAKTLNSASAKAPAKTLNSAPAKALNSAPIKALNSAPAKALNSAPAKAPFNIINIFKIPKLSNILQINGIPNIITPILPILLSSSLIMSHLNTRSEVIYQQSSPSIVKISSYGIHQDPFSIDKSLEYLQNTGTGFSFGNNNYIITNNHVISDAINVKITTKDLQDFDAKIIGQDEKHDIAILHINKILPKLKICKNNIYNIGHPVLAIGNPFGFDWSMTSGIISGINRDLDQDENNFSFFNLIQTDAPINPGNSGGPLLDGLTGCVLGVNSAIVSTNGSNSGIGFTIPIDNVTKIIDNIVKKSPKLQLGLIMLPDKLTNILDIKGVVLADTVPGSYADKLGLIGTSRDQNNRPIIGDIIIGLQNKKIQNTSDVYKILDNLKKTDTIKLVILRDNNIKQFQINF